ncbi:MAG: acyl-CoA/acyl-ACP dehydrogenase, partial [Myxococcales bacterium]|nr:acyl-CoA/acyl-ACP dehydrogenase [Myxococcales bacterium]
AGELGNELFVARTAWNAIVDNMAELDFKPTIERACVATEGKTVLAEACIRTVSKAMELAGGGAFFRKSGIERLMRDVRGAQYHPLQAKRQHVFTGRAALGLEPM